MKKIIPLFSALLCLAVILSLAGCGDHNQDADGDKKAGPEFVSSFGAFELTQPAARKWYSDSWLIRLKSGDPDGLRSDGKSRIWELYYFAPRPEIKNQLMVTYNRGNVWPSAPTTCGGGDEGRKQYKKRKPEDPRMDSSEAYNVAIRNGGGDFLDNHKDAIVESELRCQADYLATGEQMPAPNYKWIWDVSFRETQTGSQVLHVLIDGMNGEFIEKELK